MGRYKHMTDCVTLFVAHQQGQEPCCLSERQRPAQPRPSTVLETVLEVVCSLAEAGFAHYLVRFLKFLT